MLANGIYPIYVQDGIGYPVALTQEQWDAFNLGLRLIPGSLKAIKNRPIGEVVNLAKVRADEV
jgi:hypothetical protein